MCPQTQNARSTSFLRKALGVVLILIGLVALLTPFTPGSWLLLVGAALLGARVPFADRLRRWWKWGYTREDLSITQANTAMENEVGKVVHYYDKLGVVIIELSAPLKVGDTMKIKHGEEEFEQQVASMQVEHEDVESAKKGESVGVKVDQKTKEGAVVYKATA